MLLSIAIITLIIYVIYKIVKPLRYWSNKGVKQTNPWPLIGDSWKSIFRRKGIAGFSMWLYNLYPNERYVGFYQIGRPTLMIKDPELIKQITIKDFDHFTDHGGFTDPDVDPIWSGNLFSLKGQKWRQMRATLSGNFTSSKMKIVFSLMAETAQHFVQYFLDKNDDLIEVELKDCFTKYTNDVIASSAFGIKVNSLTEPENTFYLMGKELTNFFTLKRSLKFIVFFTLPKLCKYFKVSPFDKDVTNYFKNVIHETIKTREEKGIVRPDMINLLLETRKGVNHEENGVVDTGFATVKEFSNNATFKAAKNITNDEIASQALVFFLAGFDPVSTAICFTLYELALNPDIQDKLRLEIMKTQNEHNENITYDVLLNMKYLDMVISEIFRKWPPQVTIDRICTKPYTIKPVNANEKPVHLQIGDCLWLPFHSIHRDPKFYSNPDQFDPERFSPENKSNINPYIYIPFGSGPRNCIGSRFALLEIKVLLYNLLMNFEVVPTGKTPIPLKLKKSFQHTAADGFWMGLKRIK